MAMLRDLLLDQLGGAPIILPPDIDEFLSGLTPATFDNVTGPGDGSASVGWTGKKPIPGFPSLAIDASQQTSLRFSLALAQQGGSVTSFTLILLPTSRSCPV